MAAGVNYRARGETSLPVDFKHVSGLPTKLVFGRQIFAMKKGRSVVPHGHDNMATGFLVLKGKLRGRHWDRVEDHKDHYLIRPTIDRTFTPGEFSTVVRPQGQRPLVHRRVRHAFIFNIHVIGINPEQRPNARAGSTSTRWARRSPAGWSRPPRSRTATRSRLAVRLTDARDQGPPGGDRPLLRCGAGGPGGLQQRAARPDGHPILAALVSFGVGTVILVLYVLALRPGLPDGGRLRRRPGGPGWAAWSGRSMSPRQRRSPRRLGAAAWLGLIVTGQILASDPRLDDFGLIGFPVHPMSWPRAVGIILLLAGVAIVLRW